MKKVNCDLCGKNSYKILGKASENILVKCKLCGHIYMPYRPTKEEMIEIYNEDYFGEMYINGNEKADYNYLEDKPNILKFVKKRFATIHKYKKPGKILDIGCAMGFYLEYAQKVGWDVYGIEISEYAANYAKELLGNRKVYNKAIEDIKFKKNYFDVITMWLVFEHMVDPISTLKKIFKWLKPDGILGIKVPNGDGITFRSNLNKWIIQHPADHYCDYTPDTLERIMSQIGFELLEYETEGIYLERLTDKEAWLKSNEIIDFYNNTAKKVNIGDSLVMFFKKIGEEKNYG
ncbi:methyltransferase domain-containing protein [Iocasia frigidifontis]|uniref:Methyltransferase domain-containing protein n=1 Tax=Iocasia fonsfrigidae TaxID=2682810 RepID=A0A8A7K6F7_9FIRM|nr:class I SAM-dependent methyltransferase [Iocasia fonsfrigidae]QTL96941.1 methyltransferase domain-containing protein [Iocasia fonsfrigidae]